tara:strand:- start:22 stop:222 length:201 start_codon:yes stop_codon:yes gene_type:complete
MTIIQAMKLGKHGEEILYSIECIRHAEKHNETILHEELAEDDKRNYSKSEYIELNLQIIEQNLLKL